MPLFAAMVAKYRTTEEANGGGGGIVILARATQWRRRRATDIGGGVDKNDEGRRIWGRRWRQRCCNVDRNARAGKRGCVVLKGFKINKKIVGCEFTRLLETFEYRQSAPQKGVIELQ
jgi:hypothetical protein